MKAKGLLNSKELNQPDFIARLRTGDDAAYRELDKRLFPYFRTFVYKEYGFGREEASDVIQDVALRIFEKMPFFDPTRGRFEVWAFQILRNRCVDWLRKKKKYKAIPIDKLQIDIADPNIKFESPQDGLSPLEKLPLERRQAILRLPNRYQQFLGLFLLGIQDSYAMEILKIETRGTLLTLKSRVFTKLKAEIQKLSITE